MYQSLKLSFKYFIAFLAVGVYFLVHNKELNLKQLHQINLELIDLYKHEKLTKRERFERGLPPDQFHEHEKHVDT